MYCGIVTYAPALALEQVANFQLEIGLDQKSKRDEIGPSSEERTDQSERFNKPV